MAQLRFVVVFLVYAAAVLEGTDGHATGAPQAACSDLTPQHETSQSTPGGSRPYVLSAPQRVAAGTKTFVEISGGPFKGFIVRAIDANGIGGHSRFSSGGATARYQSMTCDAADDSATHTDSSDKTAVKLEWIAPTVRGTYKIVATIVKDYTQYYTGYYADVIVQ